MRRSKLPLIPANRPGIPQESGPDRGAGAGPGTGIGIGPGAGAAAGPARLGVLSVHLDGGRCRVGCPFCYLGRREGEPQSGLDLDLLDEALEALDYRELAFALSEPLEPALPVVARLSAAAARRGRPLAITTTQQVLAALPRGSLDGAARLSLSIDPFKAPVSAAAVAESLAMARRLRPGIEIVLIVSLTTHKFARELLAGLLRELIELPGASGGAGDHRVALNAVKPPPHWCDRRFWMGALAQLAPLLREHLDRRLFLDCYVAARLLGIGGCPARPDLSPAPVEAGAGTPTEATDRPAAPGLAFRGCVYQPAPDFIAEDGADLARRLAGFVAPAVCPFPIE